MDPEGNSILTIPIGWDFEIVVDNNGSRVPRFTNRSTGQHFHTYSALMRYVKYAQQSKVSIYHPANKRVKRVVAPRFKTTGTLAPQQRLSLNSNSSTAESSSGSNPPASSGSADGKEKGPCCCRP